MYDRVLFATDGSEGADVATESALELARRLDVPLRVLSVVDTTVSYATDAYAGPAIESLTETGETQVEAVRQRAEEAGVDASTAVVEGRPASTIVEEAQDGDVIVLGTHGRTGLDRYLIGSTTEKVVRTADVPVLAVPVTELDEPAE